jgi:hypothetical protein
MQRHLEMITHLDLENILYCMWIKIERKLEGHQLKIIYWKKVEWLF